MRLSIVLGLISGPEHKQGHSIHIQYAVLKSITSKLKETFISFLDCAVALLQCQGRYGDNNGVYVNCVSMTKLENFRRHHWSLSLFEY